jgi:predicted membrane protein
METSNENYPRQKRMKKGALGAIVILAGILLLAFNFEILSGDFRHVIFSWQMLLITIGVVSLSTSESRTPGLILVFIGGFFIIPEIFDFHISFVKLFWPLLLIGLGILILFRKGFISDRWRSRKIMSDTLNTVNTVDEGYINESNIFSGSKHKVVHQVFKGGKISNIFGGTEIDLTQSTLGEGRNELIIECVFGGVTVIVPSDWKVVLNISSIMGGFSDKRTYIKENLDTSRILVIKGSAIFGGGEIKSY